jgi:hypothetical protein
VKRPDYKNVPSPWGDDVDEALTAQRQVEEKKQKPDWPDILSIRTYTHASLGRKHRKFSDFCLLYWFVSQKSKFLCSLCRRTQGCA